MVDPSSDRCFDPFPRLVQAPLEQGNDDLKVGGDLPISHHFVVFESTEQWFACENLARCRHVHFRLTWHLAVGVTGKGPCITKILYPAIKALSAEQQLLIGRGNIPGGQRPL